MQHYVGAQAILIRLGYSPRQYRRFAKLVDKYRWPCYPKRVGLRTMMYSNEALITAWELTKAKRYHEQLHTELASGIDRRYKARERVRKGYSQKIPSQVA